MYCSILSHFGEWATCVQTHIHTHTCRVTHKLTLLHNNFSQFVSVLQRAVLSVVAVEYESNMTEHYLVATQYQWQYLHTMAAVVLCVCSRSSTLCLLAAIAWAMAFFFFSSSKCNLWKFTVLLCSTGYSLCCTSAMPPHVAVFSPSVFAVIYSLAHSSVVSASLELWQCSEGREGGGGVKNHVCMNSKLLEQL